MKKITLLFFLLVAPLFVHAKYVFIDSNPSGAKVSFIDPDNPDAQAEKIGQTPLKLDAARKGEIILEKEGYQVTTNRISDSQKLQTIRVPLMPITFAVEFPSIQANFCLDSKPVTSFDGTMLLPYGNYDISFDKKEGTLKLDFYSPATPYVAFFGTITGISIVMAILGGALATSSYKKYQAATTEVDAFKYAGWTSSWDAVMWSGVSIGTAGLIGTAVAGYYEARDRKRMRRFNDLNKPETVLTPLQEYQTIIMTASTGDPSKVMNKMNAFIRAYKESHPAWVGDVYLSRAQLYLSNGDQNKAISDLKKLIDEFPSIENFETAQKLLGDIYTSQQKYDLAVIHYEEALSIAKIYSKETLNALLLEVRSK
ncbi:MAG: hypothetical protein ACRCS8_04780 [Brevinema sp.]